MRGKQGVLVGISLLLLAPHRDRHHGDGLRPDGGLRLHIGGGHGHGSSDESHTHCGTTGPASVHDDGVGNPATRDSAHVQNAATAAPEISTTLNATTRLNSHLQG